MNGHGAVLQLLISKGGDCTIENVRGETPLQVALSNGIKTDDLIDYFHTTPMEDDIKALLDQVEAFQVDDAAPKRKRRFLIEKFIPRWFGNREGAIIDGGEELPLRGQ